MNCTDQLTAFQPTPQDTGAWLSLGHLLAARGQAAQARCCYQEALNMAVTVREVYQALAALAGDEFNWAPLVLDIQTSLADVRARPRDPAAWTILGDRMNEAGARRKALECYQYVLDIDPIFTSTNPATARVMVAADTTMPTWVEDSPTTMPLPQRRLRQRSQSLAERSVWPASAA